MFERCSRFEVCRFGWLLCFELVFGNCKVRLCLCLKGVLAFELVDGVRFWWMFI